MGDRDGKVEPFGINLIPGKTAPRWDTAVCELTPLYVNVTERGMKTGLPMLDMVFDGADGKRHAFTTSGRMMLMVAGAVQAAVIRNGHEPDYVPVLVLALEGKHPHARAFDKALTEISEAILTRLRAQGATTSTTMLESVRAALLDVLR